MLPVLIAVTVHKDFPLHRRSEYQLCFLLILPKLSISYVRGTQKLNDAGVVAVPKHFMGTNRCQSIIASEAFNVLEATCDFRSGFIYILLGRGIKGHFPL